MELVTDNYKEGSPKFLDWLIEQKHRDDLIGDIASDVERDLLRNSISYNLSFEEIQERIEDIFDPSDFNIHKPNQTGYEGFERIGRKPASEKWVPKVSPLLCLTLAWDEYEEKILRKKIIQRFSKRNNKNGFVYFLKLEGIGNNNMIKIGQAKKISKRQKTIETGLPYDTRLIGFIESEEYISLEKELHKHLIDKHIKREWFNMTENELHEIIRKYKGTII